MKTELKKGRKKEKRKEAKKDRKNRGTAKNKNTKDAI